MIGFIGGSGFENFLNEKTVKLFDTVTKWGTPSQALRKISLAEELSLYLIHGWLHLIGFNDIEKIDRVRMKQEEKNCLAIIKKSRLIPDFELASTSSFK